MTALGLLTDLRQRGVRIWVEGGRLRMSAPVGVLDRELESAIVKRKSEIMGIVQAAAQNVDKPIPRAFRESRVPLSLSQQRLWFLDQLSPDKSAYIIAAWRPLPGVPDIAILERSLNEVVQRHEILRTTFPEFEGVPFQEIQSAPKLQIPVIDLSNLSPDELNREFDRVRRDEAQRSFNLQEGPLLRTVLVRRRSDDYALLFTMHHIICDGWSLGLFARELGEIYMAFSTGQRSPLPELPVQYADYAVWQRQRAEDPMIERQLEECVQRLQGTEGFLNLPTDRRRPPIQTYRGGSYTVEIPVNFAGRLRTLSKTQGATLFMTLSAVFTVLLHRYTGQKDIVIGSPIAGRDRVDLESLIGMFVNTVALRTDLSDEPSFKELLSRMKETVLDAFSNQDVPFERLVERLNLERSLAYSPLFQVAIVLQNTPINAGLLFSTTSSPFDLTLFLSDTGREIQATFDYNLDLFDEITIQRMSQHFRELCGSVAADPDSSVCELDLLTGQEREQILVQWNQTRRDYPRDSCVHSLIAKQAKETPNRIAVQFGNSKWTYSELDQRADRLAVRLQKLGVGPETLVGVCLERSPLTVLAVLATMKAGGAYLPLDPALPRDRMEFMLNDARISVLLTQKHLVLPFAGDGVPIVCLDLTDDLEATPGEQLPASTVTSENLAYVIYTSGSTGKPKGVQITHRSLVNILSSMLHQPGLSQDDRLLSVTTLSFDISGLELYLPLIVGARLVLASRSVVSDPLKLAELMEQSRATVMQATPATWRMLVEGGWKGMKSLKMLCGGEALSRELASELLVRGASLWNLYGPTETTIWSTVMQVRTSEGPVSIGRPIANTSVYLLDPHLQPVPVGVVGELFIGGDGLARGYLNRAALTQEKFIPDPFSSNPASRMYRTGDLARYRPDGSLECLGREDGQIKIRGYRVELGEIESVLAEHQGIRGAIVEVKANEHGEKGLVAFVIPATQPAPTSSALRNFLAMKVPAYMIPAEIVEVSAFPLSPNGKVDRMALVRHEGKPLSAVGSNQNPVNLTEVQMLALWQRLLNRDDIGLHDDFFEVGGHSLLAVSLFAEIQRIFGRHLPLSTLFSTRTAKELAGVLLREGWEPSWQSIVTIQSGGHLPPLFIVPGLGGNVVGFAGLARALGKDQPLYGFQSRGFNGQEKPLTRIEDIAHRFVMDLLKIQPDGPYFLAGACMGGLVALEMAQQLLQQGKTVDLLLMIETWPPSAMNHGFASSWNISRASGVLSKVLRGWKAVRSLDLRGKFLYLCGNFKKIRPDKVGTAPERVAKANYHAALKYAPKFCSVKTGLILAADRQVVSTTDDPRLQWKKWMPHVQDVHWVPGEDSGKMFNSPNVEKLGSLIKSLLEKATYRTNAILWVAVANSWALIS